KAPFSGNTPYHTSLSVLKNFVTKGYTEKDLMTNSWEDSKNTFAKGEIGTMYLGNWVIPQLIENGAKSEDIGFMPIPANKDGTLYAQLNHDWGYAISKHSKNKDTAKAYLKFLIEKSDFDTIAGFIPTLLDKDIQSPQLKEYMSYKPNILTTPINSTEFIAATNRSKIDFYSGGYIQDLMTASDFDTALKKLDSRWVKAVQKVRSSEDSRD
ncbi:MAG: extracellular solute-binding protein, partial [Succinivibrio dextrinosolvens]|nr:extracellular solute-binding protein [Succinivibrio dextrinosolvens]